MIFNLGDLLIEKCSNAKKEVMIIAPFIKKDALRKLLDVIPKEILVTVIVRFLPIDLSNNVTDFEIVGILHERQNTCLLAHPNLHAKIYKVDHALLIGSSNLTGKALGWSNNPNIEILVEVPPGNLQINQTVQILLSTAYELTPEIASELGNILPQKDENEGANKSDYSFFWIPRCIRPSILWQVYSTGESPIAINSVVEAAKKDLSFFNIPPNLSNSTFSSMVRSIFQSSHFYLILHKKLTGSGFSDTEAIEWLNEEYCGQLKESAKDTWNAIKEWLKNFGPKDLRIEADIERTRIAKVLFDK